MSPAGPGRTLNALLSASCVLLALAHAATALRAGAWLLGALLVADDLLLAALFAWRRPSRVRAAGATDWIAAALCLALPQLVRPTAAPSVVAAAAGTALQAAGAVLALWATASLGRRLGILPADRGVAVRGPYRLVRHPMYAAYGFAYAGCLAAAPTTVNLVALALAGTLLVWRARREEALLRRDRRYAAYARVVPWRFVPGLA